MEDIRKLSKHGGLDSLDTRSVRIVKCLLASKLSMSLQHQEPINPLDYSMSSIQLSSRGRGKMQAPTSNTKIQPTATTSMSKPYNREFEQKLIDNGIYPEGYEYPDGRVPTAPNNWEEINQRLIKPRRSLSPSQFSDEAFRNFKRADAHAAKEYQVADSLIPIIEGEIRDRRCVSGGIPLENLDHLTDGPLPPCNPDLFYGAHPNTVEPEIRNCLHRRIVPSTHENIPISPNFFLAAKGQDDTPAEASRSACYNGALGARGIQNLQSYPNTRPVYDSNAYAITSIYQSGQLQMYTSHPIKPTGPVNRPEYVMTQLNCWSMKGDPKTFRQGATAYRNARDWAKEKRDELIEAANKRVAKCPSFESSDYERESTSAAKVIWEDSDLSDEEISQVEELTLSTPRRPRRERSEADWIQGGRDRQF